VLNQASIVTISPVGYVNVSFSEEVALLPTPTYLQKNGFIKLFMIAG
jgi:hypothetical protein